MLPGGCVELQQSRPAYKHDCRCSITTTVHTQRHVHSTSNCSYTQVNSPGLELGQAIVLACDTPDGPHSTHMNFNKPHTLAPSTIGHKPAGTPRTGVCLALSKTAQASQKPALQAHLPVCLQQLQLHRAYSLVCQSATTHPNFIEQCLVSA